MDGHCQCQNWVHAFSSPMLLVPADQWPPHLVHSLLIANYHPSRVQLRHDLIIILCIGQNYQHVNTPVETVTGQCLKVKLLLKTRACTTFYILFIVLSSTLILISRLSIVRRQSWGDIMLQAIQSCPKSNNAQKNERTWHNFS